MHPDITTRRHPLLAQSPLLPDPRPGHTAWFSGRLLPAQPGVYLRVADNWAGPAYALWDACWHMSADTPDAAAAQTTPSPYQFLPWCGLAQPPACGYGPRTTQQVATC